MPELPEVDTLKTQISENFSGRKLVAVDIIDARASDNPENLRLIEGKTLTGTSRRGKTLAIHFDGGLTSLIHLMISGRIFMIDSGSDMPRGCMVKFDFDNQKSICFTYLHLGFIEVLPDEQASGKLQVYGPEAIDITLEDLKQRLRSTKKNVKAFLLDQKSIAGVGNIYVDEILYASRVSPRRKSDELTNSEIEALHVNMRNILFSGIKHRGTTIVSWEDLYGDKGGFQAHLKVVSKESDQCPRDGRAIEKMKTAGRTTYYCPACQK